MSEFSPTKIGQTKLQACPFHSMFIFTSYDKLMEVFGTQGYETDPLGILSSRSFIDEAGEIYSIYDTKETYLYNEEATITRDFLHGNFKCNFRVRSSSPDKAKIVEFVDYVSVYVNES